MIDTRALLAIIIRRQKDAIGGLIALHTCPRAITNVGLSHDARRTGGSTWIRSHTVRAYIERAGIVVVGNVGVIIDRRVHSIDTNMELAIADGLLKSWRGKAIERNERARTQARITRIIGAGILVVTRFGRTTFDRAHPHYAFARGRPHGAHRIVGQRRMDGIAAVAAIGRARFVVV